MSRLKKQLGKSIPMPSVPFELGRYVTLRRRNDGTCRIFFQVPARLRPSGWPSLIPLPINGERRGDLTDPAEVGRIQRDAADLYRRLQQARLGAPVVASRRDFPTLNRSWQQTQRFKGKKPRTQQGYAYHAGLIDDWSEANGHPLIAAIDKNAIEKLLALYDDRPTTRRHLKIVMKMVLDHAVDLNWINTNPASRIKVSAPKSHVTIWEQEDVEFYVWACALSGQPGLAALILTEWEIGQRLTDARLFRHGAEYGGNEGVFRFWQSKTRSYVTIPVSDRLRAMLAHVRTDDGLYLFSDEASGKPFAEQRLGHVFQDIRERSGGPDLQLRALRHSCVVQLARAGCTVPEIASITGHRIESVERILSTYLPRDNEVAWNAQVKRGLIVNESLTGTV